MLSELDHDQLVGHTALAGLIVADLAVFGALEGGPAGQIDEGSADRPREEPQQVVLADDGLDRRQRLCRRNPPPERRRFGRHTKELLAFARPEFAKTNLADTWAKAAREKQGFTGHNDKVILRFPRVVSACGLLGGGRRQTKAAVT